MIYPYCIMPIRILIILPLLLLLAVSAISALFSLLRVVPVEFSFPGQMLERIVIIYATYYSLILGIFTLNRKRLQILQKNYTCSKSLARTITEAELHKLEGTP